MHVFGLRHYGDKLSSWVEHHGPPVLSILRILFEENPQNNKNSLCGEGKFTPPQTAVRDDQTLDWRDWRGNQRAGKCRAKFCQPSRSQQRPVSRFFKVDAGLVERAGRWGRGSLLRRFVGDGPRRRAGLSHRHRV